MKTNRRHLEVLDAIRAFQKVHGIIPSYRDIMQLTGIKSSSSVTYYLNILDRKGMVSRSNAISRSIRVLKAGQASDDMMRKAQLLNVDIYRCRIEITAQRNQKSAQEGRGRVNPNFKFTTGKKEPSRSTLTERIEHIVRQAAGKDTAGVDVMGFQSGVDTHHASLKCTRIG